MDKRENLLQFLDYGGNELFSSLMESDSDRPQALDRMCILLRKAVIFGKLKGRVYSSEDSDYLFVCRKWDRT